MSREDFLQTWSRLRETLATPEDVHQRLFLLDRLQALLAEDGVHLGSIRLTRAYERPNAAYLRSLTFQSAERATRTGLLPAPPFGRRPVPPPGAHHRPFRGSSDEILSLVDLSLHLFTSLLEEPTPESLYSQQIPTEVLSRGVWAHRELLEHDLGEDLGLKRRRSELFAMILEQDLLADLDRPDLQSELHEHLLDESLPPRKHLSRDLEFLRVLSSVLGEQRPAPPGGETESPPPPEFPPESRFPPDPPPSPRPEQEPTPGASPPPTALPAPPSPEAPTQEAVPTPAPPPDRPPGTPPPTTPPEPTQSPSPGSPPALPDPPPASTGGNLLLVLLAFLAGGLAVLGVHLGLRVRQLQQEREAVQETPPQLPAAPSGPPRTQEAQLVPSSASGPELGDQEEDPTHLPEEISTHQPGRQELPPLPERYTDPEVIGEGGMGMVLRATDSLLHRDVAIKVILTSSLDRERSLQRFRREAKALASLDHPGIVKIFDFAIEPTPFLVMEFLEGESLFQYLRREGARPVEEVVAMGSQLLEALDHMHSRGIVHRDIKPGNILRKASGSLTLVDFGLVRGASDEPLTQVGAPLGTLPFMAPEQLEGYEADARSDLYSLATVLYVALTGKPPFPPGEAHLRTRSPPPPPSSVKPGLPAALDEVFARAMTPGAEARYQTAPAFAEELLQALPRSAPELEWLAWVNTLLQANRELFHPLKGRLAVVRRYPKQPEKVLRLLTRGPALEETRHLLQQTLSFLSLCWKAHHPSHIDVFVALATQGKRLKELLAPLGQPSPEPVELCRHLEEGFQACKDLADLHMALTRRHLVDVGEWIRELEEGLPLPGNLTLSRGRGLEGLVELLTLSRKSWERHLRAIVLGLATNSLEAGARRLEVQAEIDAGRDELHLVFLDDGPGLPSGDPERLFAPGASGKADGSGSGLHDLRSHAARLGGTLRARSGTGGACFVLSLPRNMTRVPPGLPVRVG